MAKKAKAPLTPEQVEIKAIKKKKRGENTTKFFAVLLAAVLTFGVFTAGKTMATKTVNADPDTENAANTDDQFEEEPGLDEEEPGLDEEDPDASADEGKDNASADDKKDDASDKKDDASSDKADSNAMTADKAVKLLNDATAKAVNKGYKWDRKCDYTKDGAIDVGGEKATNTLNDVIKKVAPDQDLGKVVGNFIGIGNMSSTHKAGAKDLKDESGEPIWKSDTHYVLKASKLAKSDLTKFENNGDEYTFTLKSCKNPQKDGKNGLHHVTNDFITHGEVKDGIAGALGKLSSLVKLEKSNVVYSPIVVKATIKDGNLVRYEINYTFSASLDLKATVVPIHGTGKAEATIVYSDFA